MDERYRGHKRALRDTIRLLPDGELAWQRLQGRVYGAGMASARLIDGVDRFLTQFVGELAQLAFVKAAELFRGVYLVEQRRFRV